MTDAAYTIRTLTDGDVASMLAWHYAPPYDFYDPGTDAEDVEEMRAATGGRRPWFAVDDAVTGELVGFLEFKPAGAQIEIGLGLRPDRTGTGLGVGFIEAALAFGRDRWQPAGFVLDVRPWNERAIRAYERAGFVREAVYLRRFPSGTEREFLRMSRPV